MFLFYLCFLRRLSLLVALVNLIVLRKVHSYLHDKLSLVVSFVCIGSCRDRPFCRLISIRYQWYDSFPVSRVAGHDTCSSRNTGSLSTPSFRVEVGAYTRDGLGLLQQRTGGTQADLLASFFYSSLAIQRTAPAVIFPTAKARRNHATGQPQS